MKWKDCTWTARCFKMSLSNWFQNVFIRRPRAQKATLDSPECHLGKCFSCGWLAASTILGHDCMDQCAYAQIGLHSNITRTWMPCCFKMFSSVPSDFKTFCWTHLNAIKDEKCFSCSWWAANNGLGPVLLLSTAHCVIRHALWFKKT